ncbi:hypothetical protein SDC9_124000 [bioreactor metagenome]|uniref:Uncharacterized protein n=1 Tax=bioreactor metagenome TaxID=1076179 RepID=A0A645CJ76_9ZZZZ
MFQFVKLMTMDAIAGMTMKMTRPMRFTESIPSATRDSFLLLMTIFITFGYTMGGGHPPIDERFTILSC